MIRHRANKGLIRCVHILSVLATSKALAACPAPELADASAGQSTSQLTNQAVIENDMVWIAGGEFNFGSDHHYPEEKSASVLTVEGFWISRYEVSNREFAEFVEATGYVTHAERYLSAADYPDIPAAQRRPGSVVFIAPSIKQRQLGRWWRFVEGANWRHPEGPGSSSADNPNHPVVHINYSDASAYARWKGHQLPSEIQWEFAARHTAKPTAKGKTGFEQNQRPENAHRPNSTSWEQPSEANTWQGVFPFNNLASDGFGGRAPVGCFAANSNGLHDMLGNVWEWTRSPYLPSHDYASTHLQRTAAQTKTGYDPRQPGVAVNVIKGGSFLCAPNYCKRYRSSARQAQDLSLGTSHIGFRTILEEKSDREKTRQE